MSTRPTVVPQSLWRHRDFMLLWSGGAINDLGSSLSTMLLPLLAVQTIGASTFQIAMLGLARRLPFVVLALPAGVVVDRIRRRPLMFWTDVLSMAAMATIPLAAAIGSGTVHLWQLYAVTALVGCFRVFFDVADQSYLPTVVAKEKLLDGNAKLMATETASDASGPALAALLAGAVGAARALSADAASYAVSAVSLLLIRSREEPPTAPTAKRPTFREAMTDGLRMVRRDRILVAITGCTATANLGILLVTSLEIVFLVRTLHASPTLAGLVLGTGVLGGFVGSLFARRLAQAIGTARVMWVALLVPAPLILLMPLATSGWPLVLYAVGWAAFNASGAVYNTASISYRQQSYPPEKLGRMNASIRWIIWSTTPVGALLAGVLGTWLGVRPSMWIGVGVLAGAGLWLLASPLRRMRDIPVARTA